MNISEILRALLDRLDQIESGGAVDTGSDCGSESEPKMMMPLTQKNELLKKAVGVESEYDSPDSEEPTDCGCGGDSSMDDELETMRKRAGIMVMSGDDGPLDL